MDVVEFMEKMFEFESGVLEKKNETDNNGTNNNGNNNKQVFNEVSYMDDLVKIQKEISSIKTIDYKHLYNVFDQQDAIVQKQYGRNLWILSILANQEKLEQAKISTVLNTWKDDNGELYTKKLKEIDNKIKELEEELKNTKTSQKRRKEIHKEIEQLIQQKTELTNEKEMLISKYKTTKKYLRSKRTKIMNLTAELTGKLLKAQSEDIDIDDLARADIIVDHLRNMQKQLEKAEDIDEKKAKRLIYELHGYIKELEDSEVRELARELMEELQKYI